MTNLLKLGWIEGFYGRPWSWASRVALIPLLAESGYTTYVYAPKEDHLLRREWRKPFADEHARNLRKTAEACNGSGVEFGVGLSPLEIYRNNDARDRSDLSAKVASLVELGVRRLDLLFDDMRGDLPNLASKQAEIAHRVAEQMKSGRVNLCPTYYSDDPILDRIFGQRPPDYLRELGAALDPSIGVYWTGERICSEAYTAAHLASVREMLGRKPLLWDNYPVNDTPKMCKFLHLRGFTGRPAEISGHLSEHLINPMNQPHLSRIPAETLVMSYAQTDGYSADEARSRAAEEILGTEFARELESDLTSFQDAGLDALSREQKGEMISRYSRFDHPAAQELIEWLEGRYIVTVEQIQATHGLAP